MFFFLCPYYTRCFQVYHKQKNPRDKSLITGAECVKNIIKFVKMIKSELYLYLLQQKEESALKLATTMDKAKIIDEAYSLSEPVKPNKLFIFSIALILSLAIPIIILTGKSLMKDL